MILAFLKIALRLCEKNRLTALQNRKPLSKREKDFCPQGRNIQQTERRMKGLICGLAALALLVSVSTGDAAEYRKMTIRAATANPQGSQHVTALDKFKEIMEKESNGAITVQTFYGGSLGDEQANVKQCRDGELNVTVVACGNATPFAPSAGALYLPYLFPKAEDAKKLLSNEAFMNKLAEAMVKESRVRPLGWLIGGYRHITNSKHPITKIEDLKGLKIRVPAVELQLAAFRSWGVVSILLHGLKRSTACSRALSTGRKIPIPSTVTRSSGKYRSISPKAIICSGWGLCS